MLILEIAEIRGAAAEFWPYHFSRSHCQQRPFSICLNFSSFLYSSLSICLSHFILSLSLMDVMWGLNGEIDQALCVEAVRLLGLCERRLFPKLLQPPDACQKTLSVKVRLCLSLPPSLPLSLCLLLFCLLFLSFLLWSCQAISIKFPHCSLFWPGSALLDRKKF